ncbi:hypothetical protein HFO61_07690 [Rhizobium leguminosarum]|uniref:hypothetical protein n=1 Tax=Rhizobium leguminosarum TaxID=384 RepID=UPI001C93D8DE|nr:hypothetical protein [Rhizobium leguminosarum]MBY5546712.1 hypothetical protein [Rhizobium leguminosarum]
MPGENGIVPQFQEPTLNGGTNYYQLPLGLNGAISAKPSDLCQDLFKSAKVTEKQVAICNTLNVTQLVEIEIAGVEKSRFLLAAGEQRIVTFDTAGDLHAIVASSSGARTYNVTRSASYNVEPDGTGVAIRVLSGVAQSPQ